MLYHEKCFDRFILNFSFLALAPPCGDSTSFEFSPCKDRLSELWVNMIEQFFRRRLKCEKLTDDGCQVIACLSFYLFVCVCCHVFNSWCEKLMRAYVGITYLCTDFK